MSLLDPHWFHSQDIRYAVHFAVGQHSSVGIHHGWDRACTSFCLVLNIEKIIINIKASTLHRNESNIIYLGFSGVALAVYTNLLLHVNNIESNTSCILEYLCILNYINIKYCTEIYLCTVHMYI